MDLRASVDPAPSRLAVGLVGAGRAGSALAAGLARAGHRIVGATTSSHTWPLLARLGDVPRLPADEVCAAADLVLLTVPDDTLPDLVSGLAVTGAFRPGQLVVHAAGRYGLDVLAPASEAGVAPIALHPAMTFTGAESDVSRLTGCCVAVTASDDWRVVGEALALEIGGEPVFVPDEFRTQWHVALTHGANHLVTLIGQSLDLLAAAGVEHPDHVLGPLVTAALENTLRTGDRALTGPVARGDAGTLAAHLASLGSDPARDSYLALARATADRAARSGRLTAPAASAVRAALGDR